MEPCTPCEQIRFSHIDTGVEKQCRGKKQTRSVAVLWYPKNVFFHIKGGDGFGLGDFVGFYFSCHFCEDFGEGVVWFVLDEDEVSFCP